MISIRWGARRARRARRTAAARVRAIPRPIIVCLADPIGVLAAGAVHRFARASAAAAAMHSGCHDAARTLRPHSTGSITECPAPYAGPNAARTYCMPSLARPRPQGTGMAAYPMIFTNSPRAASVSTFEDSLDFLVLATCHP